MDKHCSAESSHRPQILGSIAGREMARVGKINEVGNCERYWQVLAGMENWEGEGFFSLSDTL